MPRCAAVVIEHRYGHWIRHLCNTSSSFTLVPLCPYWSGLWQDTCVMVTHLVTHWGQAPFGHSAGRHCTILGWKATMNGMHGLLKDYRAPVQSTRISLVTFKERQFPGKYHCFGQWLLIAILFIKKHLKVFLQTTRLSACTPREDGNRCLTVHSHVI